MKSRPLALALGCALLGVQGVARAEEPTTAPDLVVVADPKFGMEGTVRTFMSIGRVLRRYEDHVPEIRSPAFLAVGERAVRFFLLDVPLASLESTVIHEVAGHGARQREIGGSSTYKFTLPAPYLDLLSPRDPGINYATGSIVRGDDASLAFGFGGIEASYVTAYWTNLQLTASGGQIHMMDALVYLASKGNYVDSFLADDPATKLGGGTSNDVGAYIGQLADRFNRFTPAERTAVAHRLRTAYLWNYADPTLFWSLGVSLYEGIGRGRRVTTMPLPRVAGHFAYLVPRFSLSPFGAEHYVDLFVAPEKVTDGRRWVGNVYARAGSSGLASYVGAGARVLDVPIGSRVRLGGELDVWRQPVVDLDARAYYERPESFGLNVAPIGAVSLVGPLSVTGKIGYKTAGFVMGLPMDEGLHGYLGVALRP